MSQYPRRSHFYQDAANMKQQNGYGFSVTAMKIIHIVTHFFERLPQSME